MRIVVAGATGLVGSTILKVLSEQNVPVSELIPVASEKSVGKLVHFNGKDFPIVDMKTAVDSKADVAIFSCGSGPSMDWAPAFAKAGTVVVDNSSAWRMDEDIPLVVPEINADVITKGDKIIANPNCSTIQLVMALKPLHDKYKVKHINICTYQSVSGTGQSAIDQLTNEQSGEQTLSVYPHPIHQNCIPHCDVFVEDGYAREEVKLMNETRKILRDDDIAVNATCVRVPVIGGHSEAVTVEFESDYNLQEVVIALASTPGVEVLDNPVANSYPMAINAQGKDEVFVGRIRRDFSRKNSLNLWIVADNLRKGAATNAVQITQYLNKAGLV